MNHLIIGPADGIPARADLRNDPLCEPIMSDEGIYPTLFDTTIAIAGSSAWIRRTGGNFLLKRKPKAARPA